MSTAAAQASAFLDLDRIAVAGVRRQTDDAANSIYRKLRDTDHQVFAVNPNADRVEGDPCYPDLKSIPGGVQGVVVVTRPEIGEQIVRECAEIGVNYVWMHRSFGDGSVSEEAVRYCLDNDIDVIAGGCPNMYCKADFGHKCMKWIGQLTGSVPK